MINSATTPPITNPRKKYVNLSTCKISFKCFVASSTLCSCFETSLKIDLYETDDRHVIADTLIPIIKLK